MENIKKVYSRDLTREDVAGWLKVISNNNETLYKSLLANMKSNSSLGVREDVLLFLCENVQNTIDDMDFNIHLVQLFPNTEIGPDVYAWIFEYYNSGAQVFLNNFFLTLTSCIENKVPFETIKEKFELCKDSNQCYEVLACLDGFDENSSDDYDDEELNSYPLHVTKDEQELSEVSDSRLQLKKDDNVVNVFNELASLMSGKDYDRDTFKKYKESFDAVMSDFLEYQQKFNINVRKICTDIMQDWELDRDDYSKLKMIYNLQQKVLMSQQQKLYSLREENESLREKISEYERLKSHWDNITEKSKELEKLTSNVESFNFLR